VTHTERALACAVGIVPATVAGVLLLRCGATGEAWTLEVVTAIVYLLWLVRAR